MKLITHFELATKSKNELHALSREVSGDLARSAPGTMERTNALASLENIARELGARFEP